MKKSDQSRKVLMLASVASMIDQFNMPNIRLLQEMGYEVHVACNFKEGNTCNAQRIDQLLKQLHDMRVIVHQWNCPRKAGSVKKCFAAYRQLLSLTECCRYAWMHCHSPVGGVLARLAANHAGVPVVYTAHGFHFYRGAPAKNWLLYYPVEKLLSHWTDILIVVNKEDYCFAKQNFRVRKIYYIPGVGIDIDHFRKKAYEKNDGSSLREKYHISKNAVLILSVGELSRRKNHRIGIAALAGLTAQGQDAYYLICGQGALKKKLARYAHRLGVSGRLRMTGFLDHIEKAYAEADIFLFPSYQEGMPMALMEAMAAGLPCAVSDIRGNRELINAGELRFVPDQAGKLQEILACLINNTKFRTDCGIDNREKISDYNLSVVQKKMKKIYLEMDKGI